MMFDVGSVDSEEYESHILTKELAQLEKTKDKDQKVQIYTMDLQSVLRSTIAAFCYLLLNRALCAQLYFL